jgi:hypothetical protein
MTKMIAKKVAVIALSSIALAAFSFTYGGTSNASVLRTDITKEDSSYLSGYYAAQLKDPFTHITATFTVPEVNCNSDGHGNEVLHYVELLQLYGAGILAQYQAGIKEFCRADGQAGYNSWYSGTEGDNNEGGVEHGVHPGDRLTASVTSEKDNRMEFEVIDSTHPSDSFRINVAGQLSSAPTFNGAAVFTDGSYGSDILLYGPLDFDRVDFRDIKISDTAGSGGFGSPDWRSYVYILDGHDIAGESQVNVTPTSLGDNGEAFDNIWLAYSYH